APGRVHCPPKVGTSSRQCTRRTAPSCSTRNQARVVCAVDRFRSVAKAASGHRCCRRLGLLDRAEQGAGLVLCLLVLEAWLGVVDYAAAGLDMSNTVLDDCRTNADRRVYIAGEVEVTDAAGVDAAPVLLKLGDDLHRPDLWRSGNGPGRETGAK